MKWLGSSRNARIRWVPRSLCAIGPKRWNWRRSLGAGMVTINDVIAQTAHPATPFGGRGASGWGVTQGAEGLLAMTVPQVISERKGKFRPHYATADATKHATAELLKGLLRWRHAGRWRQRWSGFGR